VYYYDRQNDRNEEDEWNVGDVERVVHGGMGSNVVDGIESKVCFFCSWPFQEQMLLSHKHFTRETCFDIFSASYGQ
jgi:hypothetical protein